MRPNFYAIDAIAFGFRFAITGLPTALRLGWLPFLIVTAASVQMNASFTQAGIDPFETVRSGFGSMMDGGSEFDWEWETTEDYEDLSPATSVWGLLALLGYVLFIPSVVALYRKAANVEVRGGFLPVFGGAEWRFFASVFLMPLVLVAFLLLVAFAVMAAVFAAEITGLEIIVVGAGLVAAVSIAWFMVRFSLFQPYVAVTNSLNVMGALSMTAGRFWKLLGTFILVFLILVLVAIAWAIVFGTGLAVTEFGSVSYTGVTIVGSAANVLISIIGYGIIGRIVGDLLGTTDDDEPFTDEPLDDDEDLLDELVGDDDLDSEFQGQEDPMATAAYADKVDGSGDMMRRFESDEPLQRFEDTPVYEPIPVRNRSSVMFIRNRRR